MLANCYSQLQTCSPPPALPASPRPAAPPCATPPPRRTRGSPRPRPTRTSARATPRTRTRATTSTVSTQLGALTAAKFLIPALIVGGGVVYYTSMAGAKESVKGSTEGLTKEQTALKTASVSFRWEELTAGPGGQVRRGDADRRAEEGGEGVSRCCEEHLLSHERQKWSCSMHRFLGLGRVQFVAWAYPERMGSCGRW